MYRSGNLVTVGLLLALTTHAFGKGHAVDIAINGIGPPVDNAAFRTVQQVIGHAIAEGVLDEFVVTGYGIEGGYSACAEAAPHTSATEFRTFVRQLRSIAPDPGGQDLSRWLRGRSRAAFVQICPLSIRISAV